MSKEKQQTDRRAYFRGQNSWNKHRAWHIYVAARELEQPFSLGALRDVIGLQTGVRPRVTGILEEAGEFYETYHIAIISRVEPGADAFVVNRNIDLTAYSYRAIIRPPQACQGYSSKTHSQKVESARRYDRNYRRLIRHPERFMAHVFQSTRRVSVEEISSRLPELTEGVPFRFATIRRVLARYIREERGPPYLEQTCEGLYRRIEISSSD